MEWMQIAVLAVVVGLFLLAMGALQIYLSGKQAWWLGLLVPGLLFVYSALRLLGNLETSQQMRARLPLSFYITTFLVANLPTAVYLGIYWLRYRQKKSGHWWKK